MDRRDFLRMGGLAALWSAVQTPRIFAQSGNQTTVVVIGAGVAGIAAARELKDAGVSVIVLEGRERVGGRVWSNRDLGHPIDLGASWIHGVTGNPLTELADELKIERSPTDYDDVSIHDHDGRALAGEEITAISSGFAELMGGVEEVAYGQTSDISVGGAIDKVLAGEALDPIEVRAVNWARASLEVTSGAGMDELSLMNLGDDKGYGGGDQLFPGGYEQLVMPFAKDLDIRTKHVVQTIHHDSKGVRVVTDQGEFKADAAIVTLPLGVLKKGSVTFEPALSKAKQKAIGRLGFGVLNKVAMRFPKRFWPTDPEFFGYMSNTAGEYPSILNLAHHADIPAIMAFTGGPFARSIESKTDAEISTRIVQILASITGEKVPEPEGVVVTRWASDPFAYGSYSHIAVGATGADFETLAKPQGRLFFAGEATTREYPGTVHGAMFSGMREAERVYELLK